MGRLLIIALCVAGLSACTPAADNRDRASESGKIEKVQSAANAIAALPENLVDPGDPNAPPPPYVAGPDDAKGANEIGTALPGQHFYRDLPAARLLRGDWTVEHVGWFAVQGSATPPRVPVKLERLEGARVRIDRQLVHIRPTGPRPPRDMALDCAGVSYLDKDGLVASEHLPQLANSGISREDVLRDYAIAVAEKELVSAYPGIVSTQGQVMAIYCSDTIEEEGADIATLTGALVIDRGHMVLLFNDGTTLLALRDA